ncbi:uncharacterized protein LOC144164226 isoform X2 [Haemaphysalis longicornis]
MSAQVEGEKPQTVAVGAQVKLQQVGSLSVYQAGSSGTSSAIRPSNGELSREEKERLLQERMEQIRIKNEELLRRHAEIEADKRNADLLSSTAVMDSGSRKTAATAPPAAGGDQAPVESKPPAKREPRVKPLAPDEGPPPDPGFRFLADRLRDQQGGDRGGSRRHRDNYGGQDFENVRLAMRHDRALQKESGGVLPPKLSMTGRQRREYEEWKSERSSIDAERLQRQLDAQGNYVREWDLHKAHLRDSSRSPSPERTRQTSGSDNGPAQRGGYFRGDVAGRRLRRGSAGRGRASRVAGQPEKGGEVAAAGVRWSGRPHASKEAGKEDGPKTPPAAAAAKGNLEEAAEEGEG